MTERVLCCVNGGMQGQGTVYYLLIARGVRPIDYFCLFLHLLIHLLYTSDSFCPFAGASTIEVKESVQHTHTVSTHYPMGDGGVGMNGVNNTESLRCSDYIIQSTFSPLFISSPSFSSVRSLQFYT